MKDTTAIELYDHLYQALVEKAPEPVLVVDVSTGQLIDANSRAAQFFQCTREALLQHDFFQQHNRLDNALPYTAFPEAPFKQALKGESPIFKWPYRSKQGYQMDCQLGLVQMPPLEKEWIRVSILYPNYRDQSISEMQKNEEKLALAVEVADLGTYDWYPLENRLIWDEKMYALYRLPVDSEKDIGEHFISIVYPEDLKRVQQHFMQLFAPQNKQNSFEHEYRILIDDKIHYVLAHGSLFRNEQGEVFRVIGTAQDITSRKEAEKQLRYQAALLDNISDAVVSTDIDSLIISWNQAAEKLFGWAAEDVVGKEINHVITYAYVDWEQEEVEAELSKNGVWKGEAVEVNKAGEKLHLSVSINLVYNAARDAVGTITICHDFSKQKRAIEAAKEFRARWKSVAESPFDWLVIVDREGIIQYINRDTSDLRSEVTIQKTSIYSFISAEQHESIRTIIEEVFTTGKPGYFESYITTLQQWMSNHVGAIWKDGQVVQVSVMSRSINQQKTAERKLKETTWILEEAERLVHMGSWDWNMLTEEIKWSKGLFRVFGRDPKDGTPSLESYMRDVHPEDQEHFQNSLAKAINGKKEYTIEYRLIRPSDKSERYLMGRGEVFFNEKGQPERLIGSVRDITDQKRMEMALRKSEALYRSAIEGNMDAFYLLKSVRNTEGDIIDFRILEVNENAVQQLALSKAELEGSLLCEKFPMNIVLGFFEQYKKVVETGNPLSQDYYLEGGQAEKGWYHHQVIKVRDGIAIMNRNITERKINEQKIRESEERFHSVFEQQFQFMAILSPEGRILEINDLPLKVTKYNKEDYIGKYFWEAPAWKNLPEWQMKIKEQVHKAANATEPVQAEDLLETADGDIRTTITAYSAIRDSNMNLRYILVQATDNTEKKLAEDALKKAKEELSKISQRFQISTQAAQIGIWEWDIEDDVLIWDDVMYQLYQLNPEAFSGNIDAWRSRVHPNDVERTTQGIWQAIKEYKTLNTEFRILWPNRSIRYIKLMASIQRDESGQVIRMVGTNWDITKEKEAERQKIRASQLELKNKELEQFAYVASHDLQEPIRTVIGFVELLQRYLAPAEHSKTQQYMDFISQAADRMHSLIRGLLDYSLIGRNKQWSRVDCNALLHAVVDDLNAQVERTGTTIHIGELPHIRGAETELRVLFQNLISNAIKFRKKEVPPVIHVSAENKGEFWEFAVKDNGIGIEEKFQEKIFVIFQRLNPRANFEGSGIGLAHCQKIVDLHGGNIRVESTPGLGSTFYFTIPIESV